MKKETLEKELVHIVTHENKWIKVHAAEFLIWEGLNRSLVQDIYQQEETIYQNEPPYRIGVWRVLYQAAENQMEKDLYLQKIVNAYQEKVDTLHIVETLAKLKVPFTKYNTGFKDVVLASDKLDAFSIYGWWNLYADTTVSQDLLFNKLLSVLADSSADETLQIVTSYVFRYVPIADDQWLQLANAYPIVQSEKVQKQLLVTLLQRSKEIDENYKNWRAKLLNLCTGNSDQGLIMSALSYHKDDFNESQLNISYSLLSDKTSENYNADLHATAAYSLLKYLNK